MKAYEIPVSICVYKMLRRDHGYSRHIRVDTMVLWKHMRYPKNLESAINYLADTSDKQTRITIVCPYASVPKLYGLCRALENTFKYKMMIYIEACVDNGHDASEAIRRFMDKYDLAMEELEWETAWKGWQRYRKREKARELIPLWIH
jgi:hypothetical protein